MIKTEKAKDRDGMEIGEEEGREEMEIGKAKDRMGWR
jgi:hypothetical protein